MRQPVFSAQGAPPKGPYTPAIVAQGPMVFISGQGPVDPLSGEFRLGSFAEQAELTFQNIAALLEAAGSSWAQVVKVNAYLADMSHFAEYNQIYKKYLVEPYPARTTVQSSLSQIAIEIDCIALVS